MQTQPNPRFLSEKAQSEILRILETDYMLFNKD